MQDYWLQVVENLISSSEVWRFLDAGLVAYHTKLRVA